MSPRDRVWIAAGLAIAILIRVLLLPTQGLRGDIDQFVGWVHHIATVGLESLYQAPAAGAVSFGPVMAYIWTLLASAEPAFHSATDASDVGVRVLMKLPATLADFGIAGLTFYILRDTPRWAAAAALAYLLHPAVVYVGAWWGQYESIYLLSATGAAGLALARRNGWAAAALAVSVLTKPQAIPLLVPFAAWFWATEGRRGLARTSLIGVAVAVALWAPFIASGGPFDYVRNLTAYQGDVYAVLSLRAWNLWWLVQEALASGSFVVDGSSIAGPLTFRHVGYLVTALLEVFVALAIIRDPHPRTFVLGLAASVMVAFTFLTAMHERYAFGAVVFLGLLLREPAPRTMAAAFGVVFTLNLVAAVPPDLGVTSWLVVGGLTGILGSLGILLVTVATLHQLSTRDQDAQPVPT